TGVQTCALPISGVAKPERIYGALTTANYFDVLGVHPILGRAFLPEEGTLRAGAAVIVIGYAVWQNHFAGDPQIVGKTIQINRHPYTVVGVAPRDFTGCAPGLRTELWIPVSMDRDVWGFNRPDYRGIFWLNVLGKLRPGVTKNQAQAELNLLMRGIAERFPEDHRDSPNEISLDPLWPSPFGINGYLYKILPMLLGLAGVLLVLFVTIAVSILAAIIFGIFPALRSSSLPVQSVLKEEATSVSLTLHKSRLLSGLVVAQISLSLVLLVCAGLFTRSLQKAQQSD